jgi:hypothetical protein
VACASQCRPGPSHRPPPGDLLLYFLEYYGRQFNPQAQGIAVDQGFGMPFSIPDYLLSIGRMPEPRGGALVMAADPVMILDPLDIEINVSRCCFRVAEIQWMFSQCLQLLEFKGTDIARKAHAGRGRQLAADEEAVNILGLIMSY